MKKIIPQSIKNIYHFFRAVLASFWFGFPSKKMKVIGVTGTNGKTTTIQMVASILEETGAKIALASTIKFKIGKKEWVNDTKFTTLSPWKIQKFLHQAKKAECQYAVLEISSHSLDQNRVWGINFDTAVVTNITREHLDYHKTMKKYRRAKLRLFKMAPNLVVNLGMKDFEEFIIFKAKNIFGYSVKPVNLELRMPGKSRILGNRLKKIIANEINLGSNSSSFRIGEDEYKINIPGIFNVENALAAICVGLTYQFPEDIIKRALEKMPGVPGRLENVPNDREISIVIDYAVTPDSLEKLYQHINRVRENTPGESRIISLLGACGQRDQGKRPIMGNIVERYSDFMILTNEDPYEEDPWQIIHQIKSGINEKEENKSFWIIMDRREAIKKALSLAERGDFVVLTGKGAEKTMAIGKERVPWNEKKVVIEELEKIK